MANTLKYPSGTWVNYDGLQVVFPGAGIRDAVVGKATVFGDDQELLVDIVYTALPAADANVSHVAIYGGLSNAAIPSGALIKSSVMTTVVPFDSASDDGNLSVGLVEADGTEIDNDGLLAATAQSSMDAVGEVVTGAGALVGTILTKNGYVSVNVTTHTFTAGQGRLKITYFMPTTNSPEAVPA